MEVDVGWGRDYSCKVLVVYDYVRKMGKFFIIFKLVLFVDGCIVMKLGESKWIMGE